MPRATFDADFASFNAAVDAATVRVKGFEGGAASAERSLNRMVDSFSGRKIITEATLAAEAVARIGGTSKLTESELARIGNTAAEAAAKLRAFGQDVPEKIDRLAQHSTGARTSTEALAASVGRFDSILQQFGVSIGGPSKALTEMAGASGQTVGELGLLSTAGLVAGAAIGGWEVGRWIANLFDLDEAIARSTASLLGFGSVADQEAGAKADTLGRASAIAGFKVEQLSTALVILTEATRRQTTAVDTAENRIKGWHGELDRAGVNGAQLSKELKSQAFSIDELAKKYDVSVAAIQNFTREEKTAADETEKAAAKIHAANERKIRDQQAEIDAAKPFKEAMQELSSVGLGWAGTLDTVDGAIVEAIKYYLQAGVSQKALAEAYGLSDAQIKSVSSSMKADADATKEATIQTEKLTAARKAQIEQLDAEAEARAKATEQRKKQNDEAERELKLERERGGSMTFDLSTEEGMATFKRANPGARVSVGTEYFKTHTLQDAIAAGLIDLYAAFKGMFSNILGGIPHLQGGATNFRGGVALVGERGPEVVTLPSGSNVIPFGHAGGGGQTNNFYLVDNTESLARKVSAKIMEGSKRGGKVGI